MVLRRIWLEGKEEDKSGNLCIETGAIRFVSWANKWPCWLKRDVEAKNFDHILSDSLQMSELKLVMWWQNQTEMQMIKPNQAKLWMMEQN